MIHIKLGKEEFVPIKDPKLTFSNYMVSNKGRVINIKTGKIKAQVLGKLSRNAYYRVSLSADEDTVEEKRNGKCHSRQVHTLVTNSFYGIRPEGLVVNHKNGIKTDNNLDNLEYCTLSENTLHALRMGLLKPKYGDECKSTKYPDKMIHEVCSDLENGLYVSDVSKKYNIPISIVSSLFHKKYRTYISSKYDFNKTKYKSKPPKPKYNDHIIHKICKYLERPNMNIMEASKKFDIPISTIKCIVHGKYRKDISSMYDLSKFRKPHGTIPESTIVQICEMLQNGVGVNKISRKLGVEHNTVSAIRRRKQHIDVSKNYDFSKCKIRETIDKNMAIAIAELLQDGYRVKDVAAKLRLNVDTVRKVKKHRLGKPWINDYKF